MILTPDNRGEYGPCRVYDGDGAVFALCTLIDTETGDFEQFVVDRDGVVIVDALPTPAARRRRGVAKLPIRIVPVELR